MVKEISRQCAAVVGIHCDTELIDQQHQAARAKCFNVMQIACKLIGWRFFEKFANRGSNFAQVTALKIATDGVCHVVQDAAIGK